MIMKRWRAGSLSMGLILVASGIMLMVSLVARIDVLNILLTFWPIILICLGIEILLFLFARRDEGADVKVRYDVLSVLFIGFILSISTLFYIVTFSIGLLGDRYNAMEILGIMDQDAYVENSIELAGANELMVFSGGHMDIKVIHTSSDNIRVDCRISAQTNNEEYATSILKNAVSFELGERAYMMTNTSAFNNHRRIGYPTIDCIIYLPRGKTLDMSQYNGRLQYDVMLEGQIVNN